MEAVFMPVAVFVGQVFAVAADGFFAFLTVIGVQALIALDTVRILLPKDVLLPKQGLLAVVAVIPLGHPDTWEASLTNQQQSA